MAVISSSSVCVCGGGGMSTRTLTHTHKSYKALPVSSPPFAVFVLLFSSSVMLSRLANVPLLWVCLQ